MVEKNIEPDVFLVEVPNDNKCLFHCINQTLFLGKFSIEAVKKICIDEIEKDLRTNQHYLPFFGSKNEVYAYLKDVLRQDYWGSHLEMCIFSKLYCVEFIVLESKNKTVLQRIVNPETSKYKKRVYFYWCSLSNKNKKENDRNADAWKENRLVHYNFFAWSDSKKNLHGVWDSKDPELELAKILSLQQLAPKNILGEINREEQKKKNHQKLVEERKQIQKEEQIQQEKIKQEKEKQKQEEERKTQHELELSIKMIATMLEEDAKENKSPTGSTSASNSSVGSGSSSCSGLGSPIPSSENLSKGAIFLSPATPSPKTSSQPVAPTKAKVAADTSKNFELRQGELPHPHNTKTKDVELIKTLWPPKIAKERSGDLSFHAIQKSFPPQRAISRAEYNLSKSLLSKNLSSKGKTFSEIRPPSAAPRLVSQTTTTMRT